MENRMSTERSIDRLFVWDSSCASVDTKDRLISLSLLSV